ncbi:MAG: ribonuclease P protein component [Syntrophomonadaceae bacterium]|jgi:ribonuclease P protein component|nr:ribonuclease P protein component [Syntrophomonadaceae bacterium]
MLAKNYRIRSGKDYKKLYDAGKKFNGKYLFAYVVHKGADSYNRYGIVAGKKVGKAVLRNLNKRRLRAIIKKHQAQFDNGKDIVLIIKKNVIFADFKAFEKDFLTLMNKAGQ